MVIDEFNSEWAPVTSGVPQGLVLGPMLFIICINDVNVVISNLISKFADDTKTGSSVVTDGDRQSLQEDLHKISAWFDRWEMSFRIEKCQVFKLEQETKGSITKCVALSSKSFNASRTWVSKSRQTIYYHSNAPTQQIKRTECWTFY